MLGGPGWDKPLGANTPGGEISMRGHPARLVRALQHPPKHHEGYTRSGRGALGCRGYLEGVAGDAVG